MSTPQPLTLRNLEWRSPPPDLEERIVAVLKAERLINPATTRGAANMKQHYLITAAIAVVAVVAGLFIGQSMNGEMKSAIAESGNKYIMLLYEDALYQAPEPGKMEERIGEYSQWGHSIAAVGKYITGEKLTNDGVLLMPDGSRLDAIPTADQGTLEGYFIITASDLEEAAAIAESCPHLTYGGTVSLRRIAG